MKAAEPRRSKGVIDYNVKPRVKTDGNGVDLANAQDEHVAVEEAIRLKERRPATLAVSIGLARCRRHCAPRWVPTAHFVQQRGRRPALPRSSRRSRRKSSRRSSSASRRSTTTNTVHLVLGALLGWPQGTLKVERPPSPARSMGLETVTAGCCHHRPSPERAALRLAAMKAKSKPLGSARR